MKNVMIGIVLVIAFVSPQPSQASPLRSGSIVGGLFVMGSVGCQFTPDCAAWLASSCNPAFPRPEPAVYTSIQDVANLAGLSTTRYFELKAGDPTGISWSPGGIRIEFWRSTCVEVSSTVSGPVQFGKTALKIPAGAKWMTLASTDTLNVTWTLR